jgi:hypothetical protein
MFFDSIVWGPHYWFFLHTVSESYPLSPNQVTKRKYYDLIQNFPLFIPDTEMGNVFSELLDKYPVSPYLDSSESFFRWVHFIHNKLNIKLGKIEITLPTALDTYRANYKPNPILISERIGMRKHYIFAGFIITLLILIYKYYE